MALNLKRFRQTLYYQDTVLVSQLQTTLSEIALQDQIAEQKKKQYIPVVIIGSISAFTCFILAFILPLLWILFIPLICATGIIALLVQHWGSLDVPNQRYKLPQRLAKMLSRDMARDTPVNIAIGFSSPIHPSKKICTEPFPARKGWKMDRFEDPWFQMGGQFLDQTLFRLSLIERNVSRYGWKRGSSGKSKFKRKHKFKGYKIQLLLKFSRKTYGAMTLLAPDIHQALHLPAGVTLSQLKVNDHRLCLQVKVPAYCSILREQPEDALYQLFTQLLLSLYHGLNLSKELTQPTRSGEKS